MSQGILVKNKKGHALISSDIATLHLAGTATFDTVLKSMGVNWPNFTGPNYANSLSGSVLFRMRWQADSSIYPLFFIKPNVSNVRYGVVNQWWDNGYHYIDVLQHGPTLQTLPTFYVFAPPEYAPPPAATDNSGIVTYLPDGKMAFDSRRKPLNIIYSSRLYPPAIPMDGGTSPESQSVGGFACGDNILDKNFKCETTVNDFYANSDAYDALKRPANTLAFCAPSPINAVYSRMKHGQSNDGNYVTGYNQGWSTAHWWAMYVNGWSIDYDGGKMQAGWITFEAGYVYYEREESSGFFSLGFSLFGADSSTVSTGVAPYHNTTINYTPQTVMVIDTTTL